MPPANYIIYNALDESIFSHGKKKGTRGDVCAGSTSRRISTFSLLETPLICGLMAMDHTVHTQGSAPASRCQHNLQQLRSTRILPTCSQRNKGEVNSAIRGPIPI